MTRPGRTVLHVITRLEAGGAPVSVLLLLKGLKEAGFPCELATGLTPPPARNLLPEAQELGIPVHVVPSLKRNPNPLHDLRALGVLKRLMQERSPALVHAHTSKAGFVGRLAARRAGLPSVYSPRGTILEGYFSRPVRRIYQRLDRIAAGWSEMIIGLTIEESESYIEAGIGRPEQHIQIPIGIDCDAYHPSPPEERERARKDLGVSDHEVVFITTGRLVPVKDQATLLRGMSLLKESSVPWQCWVAGDGPEMAPLQALTGKLGLDERVRFLGYREDVATLLPLGDVFLLTSVNEGFGRSILEAFAAHLPVVATSVGGVPSVLDGGRAGLLIPPRDPEALAGAVGTLLDSPSERARWADLGSRRVRAVYDLHSVVDQHIALYEMVLGNGAVAGDAKA